MLIDECDSPIHAGYTKGPPGLSPVTFGPRAVARLERRTLVAALRAEL